MKNSFATFAARAQQGAALNIVFLGGSLTWGAQATDPQHTSYRALVARKLKRTYPKAGFEVWDAAIGGTGSQLGAFRLERDVMARDPDLVFLDFTINDDPYPDPDLDRLASYESLVRRLTLAGVPVVQMILPAKPDVLPAPPARPLDGKHKEIGRAYGLAIADAVALTRRYVAEGWQTPDELWDMSDATHPGDAGYAVYAEAAWQALTEAISHRLEPRVPAEMQHADTYMSVNRFRLADLAHPSNGWTVGRPHRSAIAFDFTPSRWMDTVTVASRAENSFSPDPLVLDVQGSNVMLFGEATAASGRYRVRIDGVEVKARDVGEGARNGTWRYVELIAQGLDTRSTHRVEIIPDLQPGQELRLESICVAGAPSIVANAAGITRESRALATTA